jgi:hypothetical protein
VTVSTPAEALVILRAEWFATPDPEQRRVIADAGAAVKVIADIMED